MLKHIFLVAIILQLSSGTLCAQPNSLPNKAIQRFVFQGVSHKIENIYQRSTAHTNTLLRNGNISELKMNFLKILNRDDDKKYIENMFSVMDKDSLRDFQFSYQKGTFWLKKENKIILTVQLASPFSSQITVNDKIFDNDHYLSVQEAILAFKEILPPLIVSSTIFDTFQSAFLINNAHASVLGVAAIYLILYYEVLGASLIDMGSNQACKQEIDYAIDETSRLIQSCEDQLAKITTLNWNTTTAGKILSSSKSLHFLLNAQSVQDVSCENITKHKSQLSYKSAATFFLTKSSCFDSNNRMQLCEKADKLQKCVAYSQKQAEKNKNILDSARGEKSLPLVDHMIPSNSKDPAHSK